MKVLCDPPVQRNQEQFQIVWLVHDVTRVLPEDQINVAGLQRFTKLQ